jgi:hypothetical protein
MELNNQNYHSPGMNMAYWSNSQYAEFCRCPARAVAGLLGTYKRKRTAAFAFGGLLDRALTCTPEDLEAYMRGPESLDDDGASFFFDAKGKLRDNKDMRAYNAIVARAKSEPLLASGMKTWTKQAVFTGEIAGLPWKVMLDYWHDKKGSETIIDLKFMADFEDDWVKIIGEDGRPRTIKAPWYDCSGYFRSMATYREIVRQNTDTVPLVALFAFTKQEPPDAQSVSFDDDEALERFDRELKEIKDRLFEFEAVKRGGVTAPGCDLPSCDFCRGKHTLDRVVSAVSARNVTME